MYVFSNFQCLENVTITYGATTKNYSERWRQRLENVGCTGVSEKIMRDRLFMTLNNELQTF